MSAPSVHTLAGTFGVVQLAVATCPEVQALSHRALRLYLVLLARHNAKRDGWAWSLTALANDTGIDRKKVPEALKALSAAGLVDVESGGGRASTHYRLIVPPSLRVVPTAGTSTPVQSPRRGLQQSPRRGLVSAIEGTPAVPTAGTPVVPTAGTTRQRIYNDGTEDPPYPHSEQNRAQEVNPPSPPASRGEQREPADAGGQTERPRFELPARMRGASLPPGSRMGMRSSTPAPVPTSAPKKIPPPQTRGEAIRKLADMMGVRPREARRALERQEAIEAAPPPPPPLKVDASHLEELRALGWLTEEQQRELMGRTA